MADTLREAEVTVYFSQSVIKNNEGGSSYIKILPYVRVRFRNPTTNDFNSSGEAYIPFKLSLETQAHFDEPYRVVFHRTEDGAFPSNATKVRGLSASDTVEVHQFGYI